MKRRSFIASLFAASAAPVVAKAIPAVTVPVVGKIEGPESVGRYEAVESHDADGPIVLSGNVELWESWKVELVEVPCDIGNFRSHRAVAKVQIFQISCDCISDFNRILNSDTKRLVFSLRSKSFNGFIAGYVKTVDSTSWPGSHRWTLVIEADHINADPAMMTLNEMRAAEGLEPIPNVSDYIVQLDCKS